MKLTQFLLLLALLVPIALSTKTCQGCLNGTCFFNCYNQDCQFYTSNSTCSCIQSYYLSFSTADMSFTNCVACNYTYAGCVLCNANTCTQCQPEYTLSMGKCYTQGGYPVGYTEPYQQVYIAFLVFFVIFGVFFGVMSFLRYRKMAAGGRDGLMS